MKLKPTLSKSEITYAKELYVEHGFSLNYIGKELNTRPTTVSRYLLANGVDVHEIHPEREQERKTILEVLKHIDQYFEDLEDYNHKYIVNLFLEIKQNGN